MSQKERKFAPHVPDKGGRRRAACAIVPQSVLAEDSLRRAIR